MHLFYKITLFLISFSILLAGDADCIEIKSRFVTITFDKQAHLRKFNDKLHMGRLRYLMRGRSALTVEDEVKNKMDVITEKTRSILAMYPPHLSYSMHMFTDMDGVQKMFIKLHRKDWRRPAFYYKPENKVYISIKNTRLKVVAHEIGHVVVENYFKVSPPVKVHELLAQFAEKHITD